MAPRRTNVTVKIPGQADAALIGPGPDTPSMTDLLQQLLAHLNKPAPSTAGIIAHPSSPFAYATTPFDVDLLAGGRLQQPPSEVLLMNEGPAALMATLHGRTYPLAPWDRHVYPCDGAASLHVEPVVLTSPLPQSPSSSLIVAIAPQGSAFPGLPQAASRQVATYQSQSVVPGFPITLNQDGLTHDLGIFSVPISTHAIAFLFSAPAVISFINVLGVTSSIDYADSTATGSAGSAVVKFFPGADSSVHVLVTTTSGAGTCKVTAVFLPDTQVVSLDQDQAGPASPQPWQAAQSVLMLNHQLNAGASTTLIPGVIGQQIRLHGLAWSFDTIAAAFGDFRDSVTGTGVFFWSMVAATESPRSGDFRGAPLTTGAGLVAKNTSGVNSQFMHGFLTYTRA